MLKESICDNLIRWMDGGSASPTQISISPTDLCNLSCQSCWQRGLSVETLEDKKNHELPQNKLLEVIQEAKELGISCVEITGGGEPLARRDTPQIIKKIKDLSMQGWMTTNGTLFSEELIKLMVDLQWDKLTISLDGPDAETNDFLRPPKGSFDKIIEAVSLFKEYKSRFNKDKPEITFNVVVSRHNYKKLSGIISLAGKFAVSGVTFEPVKVLSEQCNQLLVDFKKSFGEIESEFKKAQLIAGEEGIFTNIDGLIKAPELIKYSGKLKDNLCFDHTPKGQSLLNIACIEPWFHIYLEVDGNVRPCCVSPGLGENIKSNSLREIWYGRKFSSFRKAITCGNLPASCNQCNANLICFSREIQDMLRNKVSSKANGIQENNPAKRKKILITDTAPLYPPLWGGPKRIWNLYGNFSADLFDITYVGVKPGLNNGLRYSYHKIRDNFREIVCSLPPHYSIWHAFEKIFFSNSSLDLFPYLWMHTDPQFKYMLNSLNADMIICSHPWSALSINKLKGQFFVYDAHNCEYLLMRQLLKKYRFKDFILRKVKKIEAQACRKSDLVLVCSETEKKDFLELYKLDPSKVIVVPNGTTIRKQENKKSKAEYRKGLGLPEQGSAIVFVGAYYKPNLEAVKFIIEKISPALKDISFFIAGSASEPFRQSYSSPNVSLLGQISDKQLDELFSASDAAINPMFDGSGVNIKMLDYMSYGLPIVTTHCGARGIQTDGRHPMIISEGSDFSNNIRMIIKDRELYSRMSRDARMTAQEQYNWEKISEGLQKLILERVSL